VSSFVEARFEPATALRQAQDDAAIASALNGMESGLQLADMMPSPFDPLLGLGFRSGPPEVQRFPHPTASADPDRPPVPLGSAMSSSS
jgi:hypothetical protein